MNLTAVNDKTFIASMNSADAEPIEATIKTDSVQRNFLGDLEPRVAHLKIDYKVPAKICPAEEYCWLCKTKLKMK